jgi:hypothetical protein
VAEAACSVTVIRVPEGRTATDDAAPATDDRAGAEPAPA